MMNKHLYKILIACSDGQFTEQVKSVISKTELIGIYIIATDKASFFTKLEWMQPDLILADTSSLEFSGLDPKTFTKIYLSEVPFVFFADTSETMDKINELALHSADGIICKDCMEGAPELIENVLNNYHLKTAENRKKQKAIYSSRVKFHKALALLKDLECLINKNQINNLFTLVNPN
ncbi:MAG: hypothetical protein AB8F74_10485 [Saprospiraceae bacterium]